jgi:hypothetical protein
MNKLEENIRQNRERFNGAEPPAGHAERFRARLGSSRRSLYARIPDWIKIASVLVFVAVSSVLVFEQAQRYYAARKNPLQELLPGEFYEARVYYTSMINRKYSEIDRLSSSDPERNEILLKELYEMDRMFRSLLKDLETNPSDERVLSAMIEHYQLKLEVMGQIINQLEKANQINSTYKSHEKTDV